ncbi:MAG TPA: hypothetical protein ENH65_12400 [Candidatus Aminicenantes bacterium]|nr:hypothetical protein [Candidatus Aminicenantes bacterium]
MPKKDRKKSRREMYGKGTQKRVKDSYDKSGAGGGGILRDDIEGGQFWQAKDGENLIDIIPYFAGALDPDSAHVKEGDDVYNVQVFAHGRVGPREQMMVCRAFTIGEKCPACEYRKKLLKEQSTDEDTIDNLKVSRYPRVIYNVVSYNSSGEEDKGVQIWHTSTYLMERFLGSLAKNPRMKGGGYEAFTDFSHPDQDVGKSISFTRQGKAQSTEFIGIKFVDRDYDISDEILEAAFILDECLHIPTYDQAYTIYWGESDEDKYDATAARGHGVEGEIKDDETIEDEEKVKSITRERKRKKKEEPEEVIEEDEGCPHGGTFGTDIDEIDACNEICDKEKWKECAQERDRMDEEKEKKKKEKEDGGTGRRGTGRRR